MSLKLKHNLDSQVANKVCENIGFVLPNHDSFVINPNDAYDVRKVYTNAMYRIYKHRHKILKDYFKSIGIEAEYEEMKHDNAVLQFSPYCLK